MYRRDDASDELVELVSSHAAERTEKSPSFSAAVFDRAGILAAYSEGTARVGGDRPTLSTVYRIASMTKSFCVTAILLLVERGDVRLDDPVSTYVPQFHDYRDGQGVVVPITLRMLLSNSSGLPEDNAWADSQIGITRDELLSLLDRGVRYGDTPGAFFQYSNLGFAVLGLVVENVTGRRFARFVEDEILQPLELHDTHFSPDAYEQKDLLAVGYSTFDEGETWVERPYVGDGAMAAIGGLYSTLGDIARWSAWLSSAWTEEPDNASVGLSAAARRLMQTAATAIHSDSRTQRDGLVAAGYGMGIIVELDRDLGVFAQHSGGLPGFTSHMRWHTDSGLGVVAFGNTEMAGLAVWTRELLKDVLLMQGVPARRMHVWPETLAAAQRIDAMLRDGADYATCADLYSGNVVSDIPFDIRRQQTSALLTGLGGLGEATDDLEARLLWADSGSRLTWRLPCRDGEAIVQIELTPLRETRVQRISLKDAAEMGPVGMAAGFLPSS